MSHKVYSNGRFSPLLTHMMRPKEVAGSFPDKPAQAENVRHSGSVAPSTPINKCGFSDVRKHSEGRYFCIKCGKTMSEEWLSDVMHHLPPSYWKQLQSQIGGRQ